MERQSIARMAVARAARAIALIALVAGIAFAMPQTAHATNLSAAAAAPTVTYQAHVQDIGWMPAVGSGSTAGTTGRSKQLEAFKATLDNASGSISYRAHVADIGWQGWVGSGQVSGTTGMSKRIEAVQMKLTGSVAAKYSVMYRVHVPTMGWLAWTKDGATAGSTGMALRIEAVQVKIVPKGTATSGVAALSKPAFRAKGHSANVGWQGFVGEGSTIGTTGRSLRLEALSCQLADFDGRSSAINVRAHVQDIGWQGWVGSGQVAGSTGKGKAIEALQIKLAGNVASFYDVYYRAHVKDYGWLGWAKNGETAGSTGYALPMEAVQVKVVLKDSSFNRGGSATVVPTESLVRARLDQIANGSRRYNSKTVMQVGMKFTGTRAGEQCKGYAKNVFDMCFGIVPGSTKAKPNNYQISATSGMRTVGSYSSLTEARARALFSSARAGDFVQMRRVKGGSHSMIVYSVQSGGITVLEANLDGKNTVYKSTYTWAQLASKNSGMSVYTATNYKLR